MQLKIKIIRKYGEKTKRNVYFTKNTKENAKIQMQNASTTHFFQSPFICPNTFNERNSKRISLVSLMCVVDNTQWNSENGKSSIRLVEAIGLIEHSQLDHI